LVLRSPDRAEELPVSVPRLRAPKEHGQIFATPALDQIGALLQQNQSLITSGWLQDLRRLARGEVLEAARRYLDEAGQAIPPGEGGKPWIVAGHQPDLFHPGVWFKNFVLHRLAQKHGATALNLIVDTDAVKPAVLQVPGDAKLARVAYDRSSLEAPYEERVVDEEATFAELPARVASITGRFDFTPVLRVFWEEVMRHARRTPLLGERFVAARRALERRWGVVQRELPMSRVCQTAAFARFACLIVERLPEFHAMYNQVVHEYRQAHGIRSKSHPVPDLARDGQWLEAPFWAWRRGARRGKLMVRVAADAWELRVNGENWPSIPFKKPIEAWRSLEGHGCKVRSRALTTTMFARLALADLFIHGLGGGIYDELTDHIIERFFGMTAPVFLTVTATLLLPLPRFPDAAAQAHQLQRRWRDLQYQPERFVPANGETEALKRAKKEWIERDGVTHRQRLERFERIRSLNGEMLPFVVPELERVLKAIDENHYQEDLDALAQRRDWAFCLYPEELLRTFLAGVR
jgi:hypothetical protein